MSRDVWFVADIHFGHKNIITYCNRPYKNTDEMDDALVANWNSHVSNGDTVWCLGDMAFHNYERIGELHGFLNLVPGNHDHERRKKIEPFVGKWHEEMIYLKVTPELRFALCHYPIESWRREYRFHLHGHTHGTAGVRRNRLDVGIDATKLYRPIHIDELLPMFAETNKWAEEMQK